MTVKGNSNLLNRREYDASAREVIGFINDGAALKRILLRVGDGITAFIGEETGCRATEHTSILAAPYRINGERAGALAVIGPMRMDYSSYTAVLSYLSEVVSTLLSENADE